MNMASQLTASLLGPVARGVASLTFTTTGSNHTQDPRVQNNPEASTPAPRKLFRNQENPTPIEFGDPSDPVEAVFLNSTSNPNSSAFFKLNNRTTSVYGGGRASLTFSDSVIQSMRNARKLESFLRRSCINAIMSMKRLKFDDPPASMCVMLARGQGVDLGWQIWIHSGVKGRRPVGGQARLAPVLENKLRVAKFKHHYSSMCAEMAVLTDYLTEYPNSFDNEGRLRPFGSPVYMMTYNTSIMASGDDGTGRYLNPCRHNDIVCAKLPKWHTGNVGCENVLQLLKIEVIGKGEPSEQDVRILVEQGLLPRSALRRFPAQAAPQADPQATGMGESEGAITPIIVGEHPPGQGLQGKDPPVQLKTNQAGAATSGIPFAPGYPKTAAKGPTIAPASSKAPQS